MYIYIHIYCLQTVWRFPHHFKTNFWNSKSVPPPLGKHPAHRSWLENGKNQRIRHPSVILCSHLAASAVLFRCILCSHFAGKNLCWHSSSVNTFMADVLVNRHNPQLGLCILLCCVLVPCAVAVCLHDSGLLMAVEDSKKNPEQLVPKAPWGWLSRSNQKPRKTTHASCKPCWF